MLQAKNKGQIEGALSCFVFDVQRLQQLQESYPKVARQSSCSDRCTWLGLYCRLTFYRATRINITIQMFGLCDTTITNCRPVAVLNSQLTKLFWFELIKHELTVLLSRKDLFTEALEQSITRSYKSSWTYRNKSLSYISCVKTNPYGTLLFATSWIVGAKTWCAVPHTQGQTQAPNG